MTKAQPKTGAKAKAGPKSSGPFLAAAVICETMIKEQDGHVSLMKILEGLTIYLPPNAPVDVPSSDKPVHFARHVYVAFRSGDKPGKHKYKLVYEKPNGERNTVAERDVTLTQPPHGGVTIDNQVTFTIPMNGLYWLDVYLNDVLFTRIPMNITVVRTKADEE